MNKKLLVTGLVLATALLTGGILAYNGSEDNKKSSSQTTIEPAKNTKTPDLQTSTNGSNQPAQPKQSQGSYVTLDDYQKDVTKFASSKKVYFFHASWCPICQNIDKQINSDPSKIPANVTVIKTDFDKNTELRQKYGVTTQYTFVQVDKNDNETKQWSATSLDKLVDGINL